MVQLKTLYLCSSYRECDRCKKILPSFIKRSQTNYKVSVMGHLTYSNKRNDDEFIRGEFSFSSCGGFPTSSRRSGTWPFSTYRVLNFYVILSLILPYHEFCCTFEASARGSCRVIYFDLRLNPKSVFVFNLVFFCGFFVEYLIISHEIIKTQKKETAEFIELIYSSILLWLFVQVLLF